MITSSLREHTRVSTSDMGPLQLTNRHVRPPGFEPETIVYQTIMITRFHQGRLGPGEGFTSPESYEFPMLPHSISPPLNGRSNCVVSLTAQYLGKSGQTIRSAVTPTRSMAARNRTPIKWFGSICVTITLQPYEG